MRLLALKGSFQIPMHHHFIISHITTASNENESVPEERVPRPFGCAGQELERFYSPIIEIKKLPTTRATVALLLGLDWPGGGRDGLSYNEVNLDS